MLSYNQLWYLIRDNYNTTESFPVLGVPQNTLRCPGCGRHTIYINRLGDEWCLHCDYLVEEEL